MRKNYDESFIELITKSKNLLAQECKLLERINKLAKYYNSETIDMLKSLVMLEETIFRHIDFTQEFGKEKWFLDIARYNIFNRAVKVIEGLLQIDQEKLTADFCGKTLDINYYLDDKNKFSVFEGDFTKGEKPNITLYTMNISVEDSIARLKKSISSLENKKCSYSVLVGYPQGLNPVFESVFNGPNLVDYYDNKSTLEELKKELETLMNYGVLKAVTSNMVTEALLKDWDMKFDSKSFREEKSKKLSLVDIYVKKR